MDPQVKILDPTPRSSMRLLYEMLLMLILTLVVALMTVITP